MSICLFSGPSLDAGAIRARLDACCLPPAGQGSVYRAVREHAPRVIGIVDGYFAHEPSVWHKEILWAMSQGVHVFGAASMGALRAAELDHFGMVGVGKIYESYRSGVFEPFDDEAFEDDDEVAVLHGPAEARYVAVSESLVNIRETLARAEREGVFEASTRDALAHLAKAEFYQRRSYRRLLEQARGAALDAGCLSRFEAWLAGAAVDLKRRDALEMVERIARFSASAPPRMTVGFEFNHTDAWQMALDEMEARDVSGPAGGPGPRRVESLFAGRAGSGPA